MNKRGWIRLANALGHVWLGAQKNNDWQGMSATDSCMFHIVQIAKTEDKNFDEDEFRMYLDYVMFDKPLRKD